MTDLPPGVDPPPSPSGWVRPSPRPEDAPPVRSGQPLSPVADPPPPAPEHPHPATPLVKGWITLVAIMAIIAHNITDNPQHVDTTAVTRLAILAGVVIAASVGLGFIRWRTTWFLVSDTELRIEHRFIQHSVDRIAFTKIQAVNVVQPFAARILGLASLRIDVGAGRGKTIEYLTRSQAYRMRDYLLTRAHGVETSLDAGGAQPLADAWHDREPTGRVVVRARLRDLILTTLLSPGFVVSFCWIIAAVVVGIVARGSQLWVLVGGAVPAVIGAVQMVNHQVLAQVNFELTRSERGVRAAKGLTSLTSESIPVDRIQAIAVRQHLLWRMVGLYQVHLDVLGSAHTGEDSIGSMLLPAGPIDAVRAAIGAVWPEVDLRDLDWQSIPERARWRYWIGLGTQQWAIDDFLVATRGGVVNPSVEFVPHARVQSVSVEQGPVARRLRLATVAVHTSPGAVNWRRPGLDDSVANALGDAEIIRAAAARSLHTTNHGGAHVDTSDPPPGHNTVV